MKKLDVKKLVKLMPELSEFKLNQAVLLNGNLHTVSDCEIPSELFNKLELLVK